MSAAVGFGFGLGFGLGFFVAVGVALGLGADEPVSATVGGLLEGAASGAADRWGSPNTTLPISSAPPVTKISTTSATARRRIWESLAGVPSRRRFGDATRTSVPAVRSVENARVRRDLARPTSRSR